MVEFSEKEKKVLKHIFGDTPLENIEIYMTAREINELYKKLDGWIENV